LAHDESARIGLQDVTEAQQLFGQQDSFLRLIEDRFNARVLLRSDFLEVVGDKTDVDAVSGVIATLLNVIRDGRRIRLPDVQAAIREARGASRGRKPAAAPTHEAQSRAMPSSRSGERGLSVLAVHSKDGPIRPKSPAQGAYIEAMRTHDLSFGVGPAGTGKTYLAMAMAASALKTGVVDRILLTRPAVEAGERLGFLPGDIQAKVDPYLRPLYDALYDMFPHRTIEQYMERGIIEIAPLAFMRGRTLNRAFVVLDEAQNATIPQMKMFLTRLGFDSRAVVTGDVTQSDLPDRGASGLVDALRVLQGVEGIATVEFTSEDVVRHELVQRIVEAYEARGLVDTEYDPLADRAADARPDAGADVEPDAGPRDA
jgi:phosphate starvation-inducible protein PhoH and related proteins